MRFSARWKWPASSSLRRTVGDPAFVFGRMIAREVMTFEPRRRTFPSKTCPLDSQRLNSTFTDSALRPFFGPPEARVSDSRSLIVVLDTDDVVFAEITAGLDLDQF